MWGPGRPAQSRCSQSGSALSARLDALSAEKEALSSSVRQREAELQAAQSLARDKEAALSQEQQLRSQERDELQGRLADKVGPPPALCDSWLVQPLVQGA